MSKQMITTNEMLMFGTGILIIGIVLASYSFSAYKEIKRLETRFDFETLDKNTGMSTSDKYYKYLEYAEFLNQKLKENKNIPMKNVSCVYLDYAQHNAVQLYFLTDRKMTFDSEKRSAGIANIRALYNMTDDYKTCARASKYKTELENILEGANNSEKEKLKADERMNEFLYGSGAKVPELSTGKISAERQTDARTNGQENQTAAENSAPNYIDENGHAQTLTPEQIEYINKQQARTSAVQPE